MIRIRWQFVFIQAGLWLLLALLDASAGNDAMTLVAGAGAVVGGLSLADWAIRTRCGAVPDA